MSVTYKDRDEPRTYTTVRRYRVPDRAFEEEDNYEKQIVIKRDSGSRYDRDLEYRVREREAPREIIRYEREVEHAPSPPDARVREYRFEREVDRDAPRRDLWDLEKYTRSTEYYQQPQPIIIRQDPQPIIIKEASRQPIVLQRDEPHYDFIERDEVRNDRQIARREEPPRRRDEEDYYYERTTREVDRGPRRGGEEFYDERDYRRDVDPRESASNYADDRYSSDDEVVVVRKERTDGSRDRSPHHRRHLAEGAIAGLGAAQLIRHHRRKQGEEPDHRGRQLLGGAALGAVGAEALSRARSRIRGSRSRSSSSSRSYRSSRRERRRRHRSRSRSRSHSRARTLAKLGTVAAVGALAGYALRNRGNKETVVVNNDIPPPPRRSRSRRRRSSVGSIPPPVDVRARSESKHRDPEHRNRRIAQAGLASAAAAGILDRVRSRSRGGKKSRSRSRLRTGVPIAAAGLGGAAVAGLYERSKARKEAQRDEELERPRSRDRSVPYPDDEPRLRRASSDPALIEYGDDPIYPDRRYEEPPAEYRRRRRSSSSSLSPDRRRHSRSSRSRSRSRSRTRGLAEAAAAAGVAGVAAHELGKRNERRRSDRERRRREEEDDMYAHDKPYSPPPMGPNAPYPPTPQNQEYYPVTNAFPPPPTDNYGRQAEYPPQDYPPYNPADYPPPPGAAGAPRGRLDERYGTPDPNLGYPPANETYAGDGRYAADNRGRPGPGPEHVSSTFAAPGAVADPHDSDSDGVATPRPKSVQFNVPPSEGMSSPDAERKPKTRSANPETDYSESDGYEDRIRTRSDLSSNGTTETEHKRRRRRRHRYRDDDPEDPERDENNHRHRRRKSRDPSSSRPAPHRTDSADSVASGETVELPPRFDPDGRKMAERGEDPLADKIEDLLKGKGFAGSIFKRLTGDILGDSGGKKKR